MCALCARSRKSWAAAGSCARCRWAHEGFMGSWAGGRAGRGGLGSGDAFQACSGPARCLEPSQARKPQAGERAAGRRARATVRGRSPLQLPSAFADLPSRQQTDRRGLSSPPWNRRRSRCSKAPQPPSHAGPRDCSFPKQPLPLPLPPLPLPAPGAGPAGGGATGGAGGAQCRGGAGGGWPGGCWVRSGATWFWGAGGAQWGRGAGGGRVVMG